MNRGPGPEYLIAFLGQRPVNVAGQDQVEQGVIGAAGRVVEQRAAGGVAPGGQVCAAGELFHRQAGRVVRLQQRQDLVGDLRVAEVDQVVQVRAERQASIPSLALRFGAERRARPDGRGNAQRRRGDGGDAVVQGDKVVRVDQHAAPALLDGDDVRPAAGDAVRGDELDAQAADVVVNVDRDVGRHQERVCRG